MKLIVEKKEVYVDVNVSFCGFGSLITPRSLPFFKQKFFWNRIPVLCRISLEILIFQKLFWYTVFFQFLAKTSKFFFELQSKRVLTSKKPSILLDDVDYNRLLTILRILYEEYTLITGSFHFAFQSKYILVQNIEKVLKTAKVSVSWHSRERWRILVKGPCILPFHFLPEVTLVGGLQNEWSKGLLLGIIHAHIGHILRPATIISNFTNGFCRISCAFYSCIAFIISASVRVHSFKWNISFCILWCFISIFKFRKMDRETMEKELREKLRSIVQKRTENTYSMLAAEEQIYNFEERNDLEGGDAFKDMIRSRSFIIQLEIWFG